MTFGLLKALTRALLIGDNQLPKSDEEIIALLAYAYDKIATHADALRLFTSNKDYNILRKGPGNVYVRKSKLPKNNEDKLDIDDELGYVAARFIASFISRDKIRVHEQEAMSLIKAYNSKVNSYLLYLKQNGMLDDSTEDITV